MRDEPRGPAFRAERRRRAGLLLLVLCVGLFARLLAIHPFLDARPVFDEGYYLNVAHAIETGVGHTRGYADDQVLGALRPPLYPAFLSVLLRLFGRSIVSLWLGQIAVSLVGVALVFQICARRFGHRAALVSGLACALSPPLVHYCHFLWSEGLAATVLVLFFWSVDRYDRDQRPRDLLLAGLFLGLAALTKQIWLYFGVVVIAWLAARSGFRWRRWLPAGSLFALALAATVLPWTARNVAVFGEDWVLISRVRWFPIAFGNFYPSDRWFLGSFSRQARQELMDEARKLPDLEREAFWRDVALDLIGRDQPGWIFKKLLRGPSALYSVNSQDLRFLAEGWVHPRRAEAWAVIVTSVLGWLLLLVPGLFALWVVPGGWLKPLAALAILQLTAIHVIASSNPRYYVSVLPLFLLYLGPLVTGAFERRRVPRWQWVGAWVSVAAFAALTLPRSIPFLIDLVDKVQRELY